MDTKNALPDLSEEEIKQLNLLRSEEAEKVKDEVVKIKGVWVQERIHEYEKSMGIMLSEEKRDEMRHKLTESLEKSILYGDFVLYPEAGGTVTVGELLDHPDQWHGKRFCDPLEPTYRGDRRVAWANLRSGGRPYIRSFAHGGRRYTLVRPTTSLVINSGELPRLVDDCLEIMRIDQQVYQRGGELVRVAGGKILNVDEIWLRNYLEQIITFRSWAKAGKGEKQLVINNCPTDVAKRILAMRGHWPLAELSSLATLPIMRKDGSILSDPGYDPVTNILLLNDDCEQWPTVPEKPTEDQIRQALELLLKPFKLFPFRGPVARGVLLAAILTICLRAVLDTAPGFFIRACTFGSGKTLIALCLEALLGAYGSIMAWPDQQAEQRKSMVAALLAGPQIIILDNLVKNWDSPDIAAMLTSRTFSDRRLGVSGMLDIVTTCMIIGTGNNVVPVGDLSRRVLVCDLDPQDERPDKREFPWNPLTLIKENVVEMRVAALTVLRGFFMAVMPKHGKGSLGSFEEWESIVRQAVCWIAHNNYAPVEVDDPIKTIDENFEADPETNKLRVFLLTLYSLTNGNPVTVGQLIDHAQALNHFNTTSNSNLSEDEKDIDSAYKDIVKEIAGENNGSINSRKLGRWIERNQNRNSLALCNDPHVRQPSPSRHDSFFAGAGFRWLSLRAL